MSGIPPMISHPSVSSLTFPVPPTATPVTRSDSDASVLTAETETVATLTVDTQETRTLLIASTSVSQLGFQELPTADAPAVSDFLRTHADEAASQVALDGDTVVIQVGSEFLKARVRDLEAAFGQQSGMTTLMKSLQVSEVGANAQVSRSTQRSILQRFRQEAAAASSPEILNHAFRESQSSAVMAAVVDRYATSSKGFLADQRLIAAYEQHKPETMAPETHAYQLSRIQSAVTDFETSLQEARATGHFDSAYDAFIGLTQVLDDVVLGSQALKARAKSRSEDMEAVTGSGYRCQTPSRLSLSSTLASETESSYTESGMPSRPPSLGDIGMTHHVVNVAVTDLDDDDDELSPDIDWDTDLSSTIESGPSLTESATNARQTDDAAATTASSTIVKVPSILSQTQSRTASVSPSQNQTVVVAPATPTGTTPLPTVAPTNSKTDNAMIEGAVTLAASQIQSGIEELEVGSSKEYRFRVDGGINAGFLVNASGQFKGGGDMQAALLAKLQGTSLVTAEVSKEEADSTGGQPVTVKLTAWTGMAGGGEATLTLLGNGPDGDATKATGNLLRKTLQFATTAEASRFIATVITPAATVDHSSAKELDAANALQHDALKKTKSVSRLGFVKGSEKSTASTTSVLGAVRRTLPGLHNVSVVSEVTHTKTVTGKSVVIGSFSLQTTTGVTLASPSMVASVGSASVSYARVRTDLDLDMERIGDQPWEPCLKIKIDGDKCQLMDDRALETLAKKEASRYVALATAANKDLGTPVLATDTKAQKDAEAAITAVLKQMRTMLNDSANATSATETRDLRSVDLAASAAITTPIPLVSAGIGASVGGTWGGMITLKIPMGVEDPSAPMHRYVFDAGNVEIGRMATLGLRGSVTGGIGVIGGATGLNVASVTANVGGSMVVNTFVPKKAPSAVSLQPQAAPSSAPFPTVTQAPSTPRLTRTPSALSLVHTAKP